MIKNFKAFIKDIEMKEKQLTHLKYKVLSWAFILTSLFPLAIESP